ncbi:MAG: anti-sigma factor [Planctomycetales bacterium]|nr:anti-sigma factor [Planctomycetales bacterium]
MKPINDRRSHEIDELLAEAAVFGTAELTQEDRLRIEAANAAEKPLVGEANELESLAALVLGGAAWQDQEAANLSDGWQDRLLNRFEQEMPAQVDDTQPSQASPLESQTEAATVPRATDGEVGRAADLASSSWGTGRAGWSPLAIAAAFVLGVSVGLIVALNWRSENLGGTTAVASRSLEESYRSLVTESDTTRVDWQANGAGEIAGFVVWNDRLQRGFMAFESLAPNDPAIEQYQLWIFDTARSDDHPVDGGVFDMALTEATRIDGVTLVPIDAKLPVTHAKMFALTVEPPGGSVVSSREQLPGLAVIPE